MLLKGLVPHLSNVMKEFFEYELNALSDQAVEYSLSTSHADTHDESIVVNGSSSRPNGWFGGLISGKPKRKLHLFSYSISRDSKRRMSQQESIRTGRGSQAQVAFTYQPEIYVLKFCVAGPSCVSPEGQSIICDLISVLFDHRTIEVDDETLLLEEPSEQNSEKAEQLLKESQPGLSPLYYFNVKVSVSTNRVISQDKIVQTYRLNMNTNQKGESKS